MTPLIIIICILSTLMYVFLHTQTHISLSYLYKDNLITIALCIATIWVLKKHIPYDILTILSAIIIPFYGVLLTLLRFFRTPFRKITPCENNIISPADGKIIYVRKVEKGTTPIAVKNGVSATLHEFTQTSLLDGPCWIIGINMTPFDVHKNCAPVNGTIILNHHTDGEFLSLKHKEALTRNERNSIVFDNPNGRVGIVQTASRLVRRIVTYKKQGDQVKQGEWVGMIKFGSQVDIIIPANCKLNIAEQQQVYAKKTTIAFW